MRRDMRVWPFPMWRLYATNEALSDLFVAFADSPSIELEDVAWPENCYSRATAAGLGTLKFWKENDPYAWASQGCWITAAGDVGLTWKYEMPSRHAVRRLKKVIRAAALAKQQRRIDDALKKLEAARHAL